MTDMTVSSYDEHFQRWDGVNCQTGVALPMYFPGQVVRGRDFSEVKITLRYAIMCIIRSYNVLNVE